MEQNLLTIDSVLEAKFADDLVPLWHTIYSQLHTVWRPNLLTTSPDFGTDFTHNRAFFGSQTCLVMVSPVPRYKSAHNCSPVGSQGLCLEAKFCWSSRQLICTCKLADVFARLYVTKFTCNIICFGSQICSQLHPSWKSFFFLRILSVYWALCYYETFWEIRCEHSCACLWTWVYRLLSWLQQ